MAHNQNRLFFIALFFAPALSVSAAEQPDAEQLFKQKCSLCHAMDKKKLGPAIKTMSQEKDVLLQVTRKGKNAMPAYEGKLSGSQIDALVEYLLANQ